MSRETEIHKRALDLVAACQHRSIPEVMISLAANPTASNQLREAAAGHLVFRDYQRKVFEEEEARRLNPSATADDPGWPTCGAIDDFLPLLPVGTAQAGGASSWDSITGKPAFGTASAHAHSDYATAAQGALADTALQTEADAAALAALALHEALSTGAHGGIVADTDPRLSDARTPTTHAHAQADVTGLVAALAGKAASTHTHAPADITGTAVVTSDARLSDARTPLAHTHTKANITDFAHTHPQSEITNLVSDLAGKAASSHTHAGTYEPANANIQAHIASIHAPSNAQANADITKAEIEAKLTGVIASHSHAGGGSDPWTVIRLSVDFTTSSATAVDVTGLAFTPLANATYAVESFALVRTATATVGPRTGCAWPTGLSDGVARVDVTSAAGTNVLTNGNITAAVLAPAGGLPTTTGSWPARLDALFISGASPSGTFKLQLASETAGTNVTMKAGSFLRYRTI